MKNLPFLLLLFSSFIYCSSCPGQILKGLGDKAKMKVEQRANQKVDKAMDKSLDKAEDETKIKKDEDGTKIKESDDTKVKSNEESNQRENGGNVNTPGAAQLSYNSKYDFVPGEKVVAFENFNETTIGDFPPNWNTNATAEVVTINSKEGKWLKLDKEGVWHPEFIKDLPENFTLEFDLGVNNNWNANAFVLNLTNLSKPEDFTDYTHYVSWKGIPTIHLQFAPSNGMVSAWSRILVGKDGNHSINNTVEYGDWDNSKNQFAHISLWRQKQRLRVYVNGQKIWDLPRAFDPVAKYNTITTALQGSHNKEDYTLLSNIRLAIGAADTRNKLITEGSFVTRGIHFTTGSDQIKPESFGVLKDIGNVLKENAAVKVKIYGHTDADGDEKKNLELSQRRAAAVKAHLIQQFGIPATQLETDGKGESAPVDNNTTQAGKANNRRVEFVKM